MKKYFFYITIIFLSYHFLVSCAQMQPPTGGPRDTIPPIRLFTSPPDKSTNFVAKSIIMEYDEKIKTDKLKEQLIITPLIDFEYDSYIKKNLFRITFDGKFADSTTYTLNFRESIQDITEGNPTRDNKFTFSTGNFIDSLSIEGYVKVLLTYDTLKEITVGLYNANDTVTIENGSPYYFTEADEKGFYSIENIKNGRYLLYAFADENKNLKLETNKESYGFVKDTLLLDSGKMIRNLDLINLDLTDFRMISATQSGKNFDINFNKYITDYTLTSLDTIYTLYSSPSKENKSIRIFYTELLKDSIPVSFTAFDSLNAQLSDTVYVKFNESKRKPEELFLKVMPESNRAIESTFEVIVEFNKPITIVNTDSMFVQYDTTRILQIHDSIFHWNKHRNKLSFILNIDKSKADTVLAQKNRYVQLQKDSLENLDSDADAKKLTINKGKKGAQRINQGLQLYFGDNSFISAEGDSSVTVTANYKFLIPQDYGTQIINAHTEYPSYTIQLLTEKYEIVQEKSNQEKIVFNNIKPGKYLVRVLIDEDGDGIWSKGNMKKRIMPEKVFIYPDKLVIRGDWQTTLDLDF